MLGWVRERRDLACQAIREAHGLRTRFGAEAEDWCNAALMAVADEPYKLKFLKLVRRALKRIPVIEAPV